MIDLTQAQFIGKGRNKQCYVHPEDPSRVVKISNPKSNPKELKKELREFTRLRKKNRKVTEKLLVPIYYGTVQTNEGIGYIFDRVSKECGAQYLTLNEFIAKDRPTAGSVNKLLVKLYQDLRESAVIISELNSENILVISYDETQEKKSVFALVDGLGEGAFLKLTELHPYFARKKLYRKFQPFAEEVRNLQREASKEGGS